MNFLKNIFSASLVFGILLTVGCTPEEDRNNSDGFDQKGMLVNMRSNVIAPAYASMYTSLSALEGTANAFVSTPNESNLGNLQDAFVTAYTNYQSVSSFDFGPAADVVYRGVMNTYPANHDIIEDNITAGDYNLDAAGNIAANGLPALDYLLFSQSTQTTIDLFSMDAKKDDRAEYLLAVINQMKVLTQNISEDWNTGYGDAFEQNTGTGIGSGISLLINAMVQDYERYIRDGKVGIPAGVRSLGVTFPEKVEGYHAVMSNQLLIASLNAYQEAFNGKDGLGLDDYLTQSSASNVQSDINLQLQTAIQQTKDLANPMAIAVDANAAEVKALYETLQQALVMLKVDMPSALSVLITYQDSDGD